jgi:His/Glu/Gln/Arg/opine family amino acid ABC transporter permease subunit
MFVGLFTMNTFQILTTYHTEFLFGLLVTLKMCLLIWGIGIMLGTALGVAGAKWKRACGIPSKIASSLLGAIPILVFLFWLHYPLQSLLHWVIDPFWTAVTALSIVNVFLVADLIRGVLNDFPAQYVMAAHICGLSHRQTVLRIQLPIIFRQAIPTVLLIQVSMLQASLFASLISVDEIFRVAQRINSMVYRPVEIYTALAVLFLIICLPLHGIAYWLKRHFTRDLSDR